MDCNESVYRSITNRLDYDYILKQTIEEIRTENQGIKRKEIIQQLKQDIVEVDDEILEYMNYVEVRVLRK